MSDLLKKAAELAPSLKEWRRSKSYQLLLKGEVEEHARSILGEFITILDKNRVQKLSLVAISSGKVFGEGWPISAVSMGYSERGSEEYYTEGRFLLDDMTFASWRGLRLIDGKDHSSDRIRQYVSEHNDQIPKDSVGLTPLDTSYSSEFLLHTCNAEDLSAYNYVTHVISFTDTRVDWRRLLPGEPDFNLLARRLAQLGIPAGAENKGHES